MPEFTIDLDKLHYLLGSPESNRKNFAEFRRRVLGKAHKDINELTNLSYNWEGIRKGRKIEQVRFVFSNKRIKEVKVKEEKKRSIDLNKLFSEAVNCFAKNNNSCTGGNNTKKTCEVCLNNRSLLE